MKTIFYWSTAFTSNSIKRFFSNAPDWISLCRVIQSYENYEIDFETPRLQKLFATKNSPLAIFSQFARLTCSTLSAGTQSFDKTFFVPISPSLPSMTTLIPYKKFLIFIHTHAIYSNSTLLYIKEITLFRQWRSLRRTLCRQIHWSGANISCQYYWYQLTLNSAY